MWSFLFVCLFVYVFWGIFFTLRIIFLLGFLTANNIFREVSSLWHRRTNTHPSLLPPPLAVSCSLYSRKGNYGSFTGQGVKEMRCETGNLKWIEEVIKPMIRSRRQVWFRETQLVTRPRAARHLRTASPDSGLMGRCLQIQEVCFVIASDAGK